MSHPDHSLSISEFDYTRITNWLLLLEFSVLGLVALAVMRLSNFSVMPEPRIRSNLVKNGPYAYIRHPMYASLLLFCLSFLLNSFTITKLLIYVVLAALLIFKIRKEEKNLITTHAQYSSYIKTTKRLIPFIW
jgi:protein-S-isoprenylcysteine O-methyltransferase Ste14